MKSRTIFSISTLAVGAMASSAHPNIHAVADLLARAIDPATMDPTKLSVLSVLKTAMPTATNAALPTGDSIPQWYQDLPADVMVLLAQMYPATPSAEAVGETLTSGSNAVSSSARGTAAVSLSQTTLTKILDLVPTATSNTTALSPTDTSANGTMSTGLPSPTQSAFSTGTKTAVGSEKWSVAMGLGVAACFFFFA